MYFADPVQGRRRRALARAKLQSMAARTGNAIGAALRDIENRLAGLRARGRQRLGQGAREADDAVLAARVRACLGRAVSHPHAVAVDAHGGRVELRGPVLAAEKQRLLDRVGAVAGVSGVDDKLQVHDQPDGIPALQGESGRAAASGRPGRQGWPPALRSAAMAGGAALGAYGLVRRTPAAAALAVVGLGLLARGALRAPAQPVPAAAGIELEKTIDLKAPIDIVFDVWTQYENFPQFMSSVVEVRDLGQQRSHWIVKGPAGARLEWDAVLTGYRRPGLLSWRTEPGASVEHAGTVTFEPTDSGTRVTVKQSYQAPAGTSGHGLALLLGSDPRREMDEDLLRMKAFIEGGIAPPDAGARQRGAQGRKGRKGLH